MRGKHVDHYLGRLEELGSRAFLQEQKCPVLMRVGSAPGDVTTAPAFKTQGLRWPKRTMTPSAVVRPDKGIQELASLGDVWLVSKREDGAFQGQIGVGRVSNADITIGLSSISKFHAYFERRVEGWFLTDAGSTNGTSIDGHRLEPRERCVLRDGSRVEFAAFPFQFCSPALFLEELQRRQKRPTRGRARPRSPFPDGR